MTDRLTDKLNHDFLRVLQWVKKSFDANGGNGSSAYFSRYRHPLTAWSPAYPETTGYLLPTLFDAAVFTENSLWRDYAIKGADWLLTVQREGGGFPGNYADNPNLSVFNSAQILSGLLRTFEETGEEKYKTAALACRDWLMSGLKNGVWEENNYVSGFVPAYYTRVLFPLLVAEAKFPDNNTPRLREVVYDFLEKVNENYSITDWSFYPNKPAFLHTVAYTIRGFLECGYYLEDEKIIETAAKITEVIYELKKEKGRTAGSYDTNWSGDYSYRCVTGILQMSIVCFRLAVLTKNADRYTAASDFLAEGAAAIPHRDPLTDAYALPGSQPLWGDYMRFKYPNWAAKFYLDAVMMSNRYRSL